jgi:hypothetical protein
MYLLLSTCPHCGAPIFAQAETAAGEPLTTESGFWRQLPCVEYTCVCRNAPVALSAPQPVDLAEQVHTLLDEREKRRLHAAYTRKPNSFGIGRG